MIGGETVQRIACDATIVVALDEDIGHTILDGTFSSLMLVAESPNAESVLTPLFRMIAMLVIERSVRHDSAIQNPPRDPLRLEKPLGTTASPYSSSRAGGSFTAE